jgi:hypothetical protein
MYDFLDPRLRGGPIIHLILLLLIFGFYCVTLVLDALVDWNVVVGFVGVTAGAYSIVKVRNTSEFRGQPA